MTSGEQSETVQLPRRRRVAATTRGEIIALATAFFADSSYHAASLRELASRAGIRAASLYYHFKSKEDLLEQIIVGTVDDLLHKLDQVSADSSDPRALLERAVTIHLHQCMDRPDETRIIMEQSHFLGEQNLAPVRAKQRVVLAFYRDCIAACFPADAPPALPPAVLALNALAVINNFTRWARPQRSLSIEQLIEGTTAVVMAGILNGGVPREPD